MARKVQRVGRPPKAVLHTDLPFLPLLFTNVQNYKNNAHSVSRCQGALIFQEKAIFRKDLLNDALGELPARQVLNGKKVILHQRERRMASLPVQKRLDRSASGPYDLVFPMVNL